MTPTPHPRTPQTLRRWASQKAQAGWSLTEAIDTMIEDEVHTAHLLDERRAREVVAMVYDETKRTGSHYTEEQVREKGTVVAITSGSEVGAYNVHFADGTSEIEVPVNVVGRPNIEGPLLDVMKAWWAGNRKNPITRASAWNPPSPETRKRWADKLKAQKDENKQRLVERYVEQYLTETDRSFAEEFYGEILRNEMGIDTSDLSNLGVTGSTSKGGTPSPKINVAWTERHYDDSYYAIFELRGMSAPEPVNVIEAEIHRVDGIGITPITWDVGGTSSWGTEESFRGSTTDLDTAKAQAADAVQAIVDTFWAEYDDRDEQAHSYASKTGRNEVRVPPTIDTLRDDACPVCFPPETLVRTSDGWVPIASVQVGDQVLSKNGVWNPVLEVMVNDYDGALVELSVRSCAEPIRATPEHPFWTMHADHRTGDCSPERCIPMGEWHHVTGNRWGPTTETHHRLDWTDAGDLAKGQYVGTNVMRGPRADITEIAVPEQYLGAQRQGPTSFTVDDDFLWMVGLYLAEGSKGRRSINFALHEKEVEFQDRLISYFTRMGYHPALTTKATSRGVWVEVYSATLAEWFPSWLGSSCDSKAIPEELMALPLDRLGLVIQGVLDGDEHADREILGQTSEVLALQVAEWAILTDQAVSLYSEYPEGRRPVYSLNRNGSTKSSARKWDLGGTRLAEIRGVRQVPYAGPVYNLRVGNDPSYTVQNILVHNCGETAGYNGGECSVCGYIKPPDAFADPDLDVASEIVDRADDDPIEALSCDNCDYSVAPGGQEDPGALSPGAEVPTAPETLPGAPTTPQSGLERYKVGAFTGEVIAYTPDGMKPTGTTKEFRDHVLARRREALAVKLATVRMSARTASALSDLADRLHAEVFDHREMAEAVAYGDEPEASYAIQSIDRHPDLVSRMHDILDGYADTNARTGKAASLERIEEGQAPDSPTTVSTAPRAGDPCPECGKGTLNPVGSAPTPTEGTTTPS